MKTANLNSKLKFLGPQTFKNFAIAAILVVPPLPVVAQTPEAKEAMAAVENAIEKSLGFLAKSLREISQDDQLPVGTTAEEAGYLAFFAPLHDLAKKSASSIIFGEPDERKEALGALREAHAQWHTYLSQTLPPESMDISGLNVREDLLKLLERGKTAKAAEEITDICTTYVRTRANYNSSLKSRKPLPKTAEVPQYETKFSIRPLGNPFFIYSGNGNFAESKFKVSLLVPTPAGAVVVWREPKQQAIKFIIVEYDQTRRIFRSGGDMAFVIEDEELYKISGETKGEVLILTVSTRSESDIKTPSPDTIP